MSGSAYFPWSFPLRKSGGLLLAGLFLSSGVLRAAPDVEAARTLLRQGNYSAALTAAEAAFTDPFHDREAWHLMRIEALMATGQYPEALQAVQEALGIDPRSLRLKWAARDVFLANGDKAAADSIPAEIQQFVTIRSRAYRDVKSIVVYGQALVELGEDPKIVLDKVYTVAAKMDPAAREPLLAAANLALRKNDFALAAKKFQATLKLFPDDPDLLHGLALAFASGDRRSMAANLDAALAVNPSHVPSLLRLADYRIDAEKYAEAEELLVKVQKVNPHRPELWAYRAVLAHLKNDPAAESAARAAALKFFPANPLPDHLIGRKLSQKYRFAEGAARQRQALEFDPAYLPARAQLSNDLLRLGDEDEGWKLAATVRDEDAYDVAAFNLMTLHDAMTAGFTTLHNENFQVRMKASEAAIYGPRVLELLDQAREKLGRKYGIEVVRPTIVEIFPEQKDFGVRTFGMPDNPGYLGVCFGRVVTAVSPAANQGRAVNWEAVLWHEFCHTVTLQATRNKMPRWLSEGISVYEERQADPSWGEHMDADYRRKIVSGKLTPIASMSSAFLSPPTPQDLQFAYFQAGLVVSWLVEKHGPDVLKSILSDLAEGTPINETLTKRAAPMEAIERDFAAYARSLADRFGPALNWDPPPPPLLLPGAEEALADWVKSHPDNYWIFLREADRLIGEKQYAAAKAPLQSLIDRAPALTGVDSPWRMLAAVHRALGETESERAVLTKLTAADAAAPDANLRLAELAADAGDWTTAETQARRALAVNPLIAAPWRTLARAAESNRHLPNAISAWRTLLALEPPNPSSVHYQLARLLHQSGSPEARRQVLMALEETPRHRAALELLQKISSDSPTPPTPPSSATSPLPAPPPKLPE
ncbi:MAG: Tetratricopeptide repeat protein [Verrucomicrobiales bacterium]|nr:Tetratricopeptide repeat protein [Verrucomicrobiales bacterium]